MIKNYRDLDVWKKSMELAKLVYSHTQNFPREELYGLMSQMRRSAVSIPSNIAEGRSRGSKKEFLYFLKISYGSLAELETQITLSKELGYLEEKAEESFLIKTSEIGRMLNGLSKSLIAETRHLTPETSLEDAL